jgi:poly [ADP-ribose] polymerase
MATIIEERKFSLFSIDGKNNKFWNIYLYDNDDVEVHFGPQGLAGQRKLHHGVGRSFMEKKIREKTSSKHANGAYTENKVLGAVESTNHSPKLIGKTELHQKAIADIGAHQSPELKKLITYFADVNAHNILEASGGKIQYDASAGTFKTTQGIVTLDQIQQARDLLDKITACAEKNDFASTAFKTALNPYLSLIPQKGLVRQLHFPSMFAINGEHGIKRQMDMLDGLESSYAACLVAPKTDKPEKKEEKAVFKVTMNFVDGGKEVDAIRKYYKATKGNHYDVQDYDVKLVYTLCIEDMHTAFEAKGRTIGNIMRLWHGTKASNMLSILKGGMIVPRSGGSISVTGRMFGDGLYFSDQSTKSIRYATGAWGGGGGHDRKFMFLVDVAMGKPYIPRSSFSGGCKAGYDSTFAKGGESSVANNEMIVYNVFQTDPVYIIEFTPFGR